MPAYFYRFIETHDSPGLIIASQELSIGAAIEALLVFWATDDRTSIVNQVRHLKGGAWGD